MAVKMPLPRARPSIEPVEPLSIPLTIAGGAGGGVGASTRVFGYSEDAKSVPKVEDGRGFLARMFIDGPAKAENVPPLAAYPSGADAQYARSTGAFYGTPNEPFANGSVAGVFGRNGIPQSAENASISELTDPANRINTTAVSGLADLYARAGVAANRIPIAALGYDPRAIAVDAFGNADAGGYNMLGATGRDGSIFVEPGATANGASSIVHEAIHRGLQKLRESGNFPVFSTGDGVGKPWAEPPGPDAEERLVRLIMQRSAGDPESDATAQNYKTQADTQVGYGIGNGGYLANYIDDYIKKLDDAAVYTLTQQRPRGGPR